MVKFRLVKARKEDFEEIANIYAEEFSKPPFHEPWTKEKAIHKIDLYSKYCDVFKVIIKNQIIGFVVFNPNHWCPGEIVFGEEMAIQQEFQNKGIGTEIFNQLFRYYKEKGYKKFMGIINIENTSFNLYKRLGMRVSDDNKLIEKQL